jgi:hypothetical protein
VPPRGDPSIKYKQSFHWITRIWNLASRISHLASRIWNLASGISNEPSGLSYIHVRATNSLSLRTARACIHDANIAHMCALNLDGLSPKLVSTQLDINEANKIVFEPQISSSTVNLKFTFRGRIIAIVDQYTYLGIDFFRTGNFKLAMASRKKKATRAWFKIKQCLACTDSAPIRTTLNLVRAMVNSIYTYGSEVWGAYSLRIGEHNVFEHWKSCPLNELSITVCKSILAIPRRASNTAALSELGVYPIARDIIVSMVKYWIRLKTLDTDRLLWHAFVEDNRIATHNSKLSWCASINKILCTLGLERYCNTGIPSAGTFIHSLKNDLNNQFELCVQAELAQPNSKLRTYAKIKVIRPYKCTDYLHNIKSVRLRRSITIIRISAHSLHIEVGRYKQLPVEDRICGYCKTDIEDEVHFLIACPLYLDLRTELKLKTGLHTLFVNINETLRAILDPVAEYASEMAHYVHSCYNLRKQSLLTI